MDWQPSASIEMLRKRQQFMHQVRTFFQNRKYLEVETPYMGQYGVTDIHLSNIKAYFRDQPYALQTSPEYHMKRLLAAGSGPIFQIARVFRDDECGRWHNPEFTLLEWYQLGVNHFYLIQEIEDLFHLLADIPPFQHLTYQNAFLEVCGFDPLNTHIEEIKAIAISHGLGDVLDEGESVDQYLHLLMAMVVEPHFKSLNAPVVLTAFPASQASLAKTEGLIAHRFEIYWQGVELANGFHELTDAQLQRERFFLDNQLRQNMNLPTIPMDERFLAALDAGLPECSGVALGLDRLFALILKQSSISQVMSFSHLTA